jgi:PhnB protein
MALINPYIHFNGNAEEAFIFYKLVFGREFTKIIRYKDLSIPEHPVAENDANRLMHVALPIGKSNVLMGSDVLEIMGQVTENDNRNTISISAESREEADKLFNDLSEGGKLKCRLLTVLWDHILECLQIGMVFSGWWTLPKI